MFLVHDILENPPENRILFLTYDLQDSRQDHPVTTTIIVSVRSAVLTLLAISFQTLKRHARATTIYFSAPSRSIQLIQQSPLSLAEREGATTFLLLI